MGSSSNAERLNRLVGFDPTKKMNATEELFAEVVDELRKEREVKAKEAAKEQLSKAVELREKMDKVRKEFEGQTAKFEKELGKLLSRLEAGLRGGKPASDEATDGETPTEETTEGE